MGNNTNEQSFWTVQLLPLRQEDKAKITMCIDLQEKVCVDGKIFGMGWTDDNDNFLREIFCKLPALDYQPDNENNKIAKSEAQKIIDSAKKEIERINKEINEFNKTVKKKKYEKKELNSKNIENIKIDKDKDVLDLYNEMYDGIFGENSGLKKAINFYKQVKKDDLVISRLKSGKYCIGRVKDNKISILGKNTKNNEYKKITEIQDKILEDSYSNSTGFSWCMNVYKWYIIEEVDIPGHISGRFSGQSAWNTIYPVQDTHMKQLMEIIYYKKEQEDKEFDEVKRLKYKQLDPIPLTEDKISESLSPYELEDLAFLYITGKSENEGFQLLPSKCKKDEVRYECYLIHKKETDRIIAFQVKNKKKIECSIYIGEDKIKKIYLYSGVGYTWKDEEKSKNEIEKILRDEFQKNNKENNIEIISNKQLFDTFKNTKFLKHLIGKGYYELK